MPDSFGFRPPATPKTATLGLVPIPIVAKESSANRCQRLALLLYLVGQRWVLVGDYSVVPVPGVVMLKRGWGL